MKAKEYLKQIKIMDAKIDADIEELKNLQALATKTTSVMGDERVQSSGSQQKMEDAVVKYVVFANEINDEIDKLSDYREEARKIITSIDDADCIRLLSSHYLGVHNEETERTEFKGWKQIAKELNYTYKWVSGGLHQRALSQVQKLLDEKGKEDGCK